MAASLFKWLVVYAFVFSYESPGKTGGPAVALKKHPLYVTVTEINNNQKDQTLEIACKIFTNDFENVLEKASHTKVDLTDPKEKATTDHLAADYITKHLQLKVNGKPVSLQFAGSEKETDATWSYFQVTGVTAVKKIELTNSLLYESFSNEINIMHVTVSGSRKSSKLSNPDVNAVFDF